jgi:hypothetical protein
MAFEYTHKWWDKNRPATLPSTGLGAELKKYEAAKERFESEPRCVLYFRAKAALAEVEKVRAKAIKKCGLPHKAIKKILEAASMDDELDDLKATYTPAFEALIEGFETETTKLLTSLNTRIDNLSKALDQYEQGNPSSVELKLLKWFKTQPFDVVKPRVNKEDLHKEIQAALRPLTVDFPELGRRYSEVFAESRDEISARQKVLSDMIKELKSNDAIDLSNVVLDQ